MAGQAKFPYCTEGRRRALGLIGGVLAAPWIVSSAARAQAAWPNRPVRYINPYPPGGPDRHAVAPVLRGDERPDRPAVRGREPRRRRRRHRHGRRSRKSRARRLHARAGRHRLARHFADAQGRQDALRRGEGLHLRHQHLVAAELPGRQPQRAGQHGARADRTAAPQSEEILLRIIRAPARRRTCRARCSSCWRTWTWSTCPTRAPRRR